MKKLIFCVLICIAACKKSEPSEELLCVETAKTNCECPANINPVCGCNDKTYINACEAACNSITDYTEGACNN